MRWLWLATAGAAALVVAGWLADDGFHVGVEGYIGAGSTQQGFSFGRTARIAAYDARFGIAGGGLALLAAGGVLASRLHPLAPAVVAAAVTAVCVASVVHDVHAAHFTTGIESHGVRPCDPGREHDPGFCAGGAVAPAVRHLAQSAFESHAGRRAGFHLLGGFHAEPRLGWELVRWPPLLLAPLAAYAAVLGVVRRRVVAAAAVLVVLLAVGVWLFLRLLSHLE